MKLGHNSIAKLVHGALRVEKLDKGYTGFYRFSKGQEELLRTKRDAFLYERTSLSSGVTLEFVTNAKFVRFNYRIPVCHSNDSIDVYVNGVLTFVFKTQDLASKDNLEFMLVGEKNLVEIYFPIDSEVNIKNLEIAGKYKSVKKRTPVLWFGDSITQGYGSELTSFCYQRVANMALKYEVLNQGIGGYWYDEEFVQKMDEYYPEKIIISLGTNQFRSADYFERVKKFYDNLTKLYPNVPTLAILPIWRGDLALEDTLNLFKTNLKIKEIISEYKQVKIVDGFTLVPRVEEMFLDKLHPNALGGKIYGDNLVKAIKNLKF
ncbi:MAG: SGNH/GDSL hydrolase family protein [Clostridia bacterium]|nr:SGNH/GDSL hydrolase family protein [Clostridia bacterium]